ncbi:MAG TPA: tRNA (adenosine(37)-N6)-threonylcarbamoyltransferase complex dimerization subunit type 1 TsaB [Candidatus Nanopelagicaceae bacterium]|nr:tRNA (adenosine(37)-N6)-threonylcarbamoyltransferase complex dimerization subunit type 1 TsaB [Candidatus Nanopelagicaceae bacterium]
MPESELVLAVDSSARADARLALVDRSGQLVEARVELTGIVALVTAAAELVDIAAGRLGRVVVARGPGSYIGVRAGMSLALGIAQGQGLPLHQVGSLEVLAATVASQRGDLLVVAGAGRGGVYGQRFRGNPGRPGERGWLPVCPSYALRPADSWPPDWQGVDLLLASPELKVVSGLKPASPRLSLMEGMAQLARSDLGPASGYDLLTADYGVRVEEPS